MNRWENEWIYTLEHDFVFVSPTTKDMGPHLFDFLHLYIFVFEHVECELFFVHKILQFVIHVLVREKESELFRQCIKLINCKLSLKRCGVNVDW